MKNKVKTKLTRKEREKALDEFLELVRKKQVPKFIMDEVDREINKLFGGKLFSIEPIDPNQTQ